MEEPQSYFNDPPTTQPGTSSDDLYAAKMQEERTRNLLQQIAPENQLLELQWRIKGYIKDPSTNEWMKVIKDAPEPSPILIARYISYLSSVLNQNTTFSNLSSGEINALMRLMIEWLTDDLDNNAENYGLKYDYSERTRIGHIMLNNTFMVLKRAQNGMESRRIFSALNVTESLTQQPQQKGMLDALKFWK